MTSTHWIWAWLSIPLNVNLTGLIGPCFPRATRLPSVVLGTGLLGVPQGVMRETRARLAGLANNNWLSSYNKYMSIYCVVFSTKGCASITHLRFREVAHFHRSRFYTIQNLDPLAAYGGAIAFRSYN